MSLWYTNLNIRILNEGNKYEYSLYKIICSNTLREIRNWSKRSLVKPSNVPQSCLCQAPNTEKLVLLIFTMLSTVQSRVTKVSCQKFVKYFSMSSVACG